VELKAQGNLDMAKKKAARWLFLAAFVGQYGGGLRTTVQIHPSYK